MAGKGQGYSMSSPAAEESPASQTECKPGVLETAMLKCQAGAATMQSLLQEMLQAVQAEREELQRQQEQLALDKMAYEEELQRVHQALRDNDQVVLNVGGIKFTTTVTTLRNAPCPSLFNAMFSGRHELKPDESGSIFIDRDGRHFHDILNYLRDGSWSYPCDGIDFKYLLELRAEADFYGLTGLVSLIDRYPYSVTCVRRAASIRMEDSWMYEDGQDEVVLTVDAPCQLLGVGLCGTEGAFTVELEVFEVDPEDFTNELSTLQSAAQSFTKADGQLVKLMLPTPVHLVPGKNYMLSALIKGSESFCCEDCLTYVMAGGVKIAFQPHESPNGTNEMRGQFPEIYIRALS